MTYAQDGSMTYQDPYVPGDERGSLRWVLVLNPYQRDNLLWLLNLVGYGGKVDDAEADKTMARNYGNLPGVGPFQLANTGDWVGEVAIKLKEPDVFIAGKPGARVTPRGSLDAEKSGRPNSSRKYIRTALKDQYGINLPEDPA